MCLNYAHGQNNFIVRLLGTQNYYSFNDLKEIQTEYHLNLKTKYGLNSTITENFPSFYGYQLQFLVNSTILGIDNFYLGVFSEFSSSGSRLYYGDYTGEIRFDQILTNISVGPYFDKTIKLSDCFYIDIGLKIPITFSNLEMRTSRRILENNNSEENNYDNILIGAEPILILSYKFDSYLIGLTTAYLHVLPSSFTSESDPTIYLYNENGDEVSAGTNGFKIGILFGYNF